MGGRDLGKERQGGPVHAGSPLELVGVRIRGLAVGDPVLATLFSLVPAAPVLQPERRHGVLGRQFLGGVASDHDEFTLWIPVLQLAQESLEQVRAQFAEDDLNLDVAGQVSVELAGDVADQATYDLAVGLALGAAPLGIGAGRRVGS